jgi:hypothetical protein
VTGDERNARPTLSILGRFIQRAGSQQQEQGIGRMINSNPCGHKDMMSLPCTTSNNARTWKCGIMVERTRSYCFANLRGRLSVLLSWDCSVLQVGMFVWDAEAMHYALTELVYQVLIFLLSKQAYSACSKIIVLPFVSFFLTFCVI